MSVECIYCKKKLSGDDIGASKKLMGRGITEFCCLDCLCEKYGCEKSLLLEKIEFWRKSGCSLFL